MHEIGCPANRWNRTYVAGTWPPPLATTFKTCGVCGLEWRGVVTNCPYCSLTFAGYNKVQAERDQARDWCRMLVHLLGSMSVHMLVSFAEYRALPPELRAVIEA